MAVFVFSHMLLMSSNVSTKPITQTQNMNFKLNMKDISKILAKRHFIFKYKKENDAEK